MRTTAAMHSRSSRMLSPVFMLCCAAVQQHSMLEWTHAAASSTMTVKAVYRAVAGKDSHGKSQAFGPPNLRLPHKVI